ncbi:putative Serpin family protein [Rosa chinensis]|uniref:Putative Serpin family protein n=1 Tax=Rosa chinensis TaxID=74649 RepID=A0A2P6QHL7_ROSCH|nr:serpin-ZX [Rosa chinensis]PRQ33657.1 putative Serpin family protein [Rosa chinensis]
MIYSPISIHIVLSLIAAGKNCPQFLSFLKSKSINDLNSLACDLVTSVLVDSPTRGGPRLNFTNGVWVDKSVPLQECYKQVVLDSYKAALNQVDFKTNIEQVRIQVNSWVEKETKGLIPQILPPGSVNSGTSLIFANALYFKATWGDTYFNASKTKEHEFHLLNGDLVKGVPFMTSKYCHSIGTFDGFKVLRLPFRTYDHDDLLRDCPRNRKYDPRQFSMFWLLPDARDGLPALAERVCSEAGFLDRHRSCGSVRVGDFLIPKFKISSRFGASAVLKKMGLGDVCNSMEIVHESVIEVDENGTTAAAATCGQLCFSSGKHYEPKEKVDFVADHPFMFLIRENMTGTVLFMGQVLNPLAG